MHKNHNLTGYILVACMLFCSSLKAQRVSRDQAIEDARQMVQVIEACHPDPYMAIGGKIQFHFAFQKMLRNIPDAGMEVDDFWWLLSGFTAQIKDGHTFVRPLNYPDTRFPGGIPMHFSILADSVVVIKKVSKPEHEKYIGCRVLKIKDISIEALLDRVGALYPVENGFDRFRNLRVYLWYADYLKRLIPEWTPGEPVSLELADNKDRTHVITLSTDGTAVYKTRGIENSADQLPGTRKCDFAFDWIGPHNDIGYLRIEKQDEFREYAQQAVSGLQSIQDPDMRKTTRQQYLKYAHAWYERFHGTPGPDNLEMLVQGLPSFTEFMTSVTKQLKDNQTSHLIIDVRNNRGGISLMSDILVYFLFGKEALAKIDADNYVITFHSELNMKTASSLAIDGINKNRKGSRNIPLCAGDYDFHSWRIWEKQNETSEYPLIPASRYQTAPGFYSEYMEATHAGFFTPRHIYVIGSDKTFSAGFETLSRLVKCGATFVGVPPAQSGNCFGMGIRPVKGLKHSHIPFQVSVRRIVTYPGDAERGDQLNPDIPLDFKAFKAYRFDANAPVLMILDRIKTGK